MRHGGEILRKAIDKSEFSVKEVCKRARIARATLYGVFEQDQPRLEYFIKVGKVIKHNFASEIPELSTQVSEDPAEYGSRSKHNKTAEQAVNWRQKYYELLEKYTKLLEGSGKN